MNQGKDKQVGIDLGLSREEKLELLKIARTTVECLVKNIPVPDFEVTSDLLKENRGAFVTIHKSGQLRGCIGYIKSVKPLYLSIRDMAESAAFRDPRFPPVTAHELNEIDIEISALTPFRVIDDVNEINVGKHGIYLSKGFNSGLLLPQVATEYGWDRITFLEHTCYKAGLSRDDWRKGAEISIFSADIFGEIMMGLR